jgi:hypothetical protein
VARAAEVGGEAPEHENRCSRVYLYAVDPRLSHLELMQGGRP